MDFGHIKKEREALVGQMKQYSPLLAPYFNCQDSLATYSAGLHAIPRADFYTERQAFIKKKIIAKFQDLFGADAVEKFAIDLDRTLASNIVDHHIVLSHPQFISQNIIADARKFFSSTKPSAIVAITSGDTPPNNFFSKNGMMFHGKKLPLFSNAEKDACSYYLPKRTFDFIERIKQQKRWHEFNKPEQEYLEQEQVRFNSINFSRCRDYNDQVSVQVRDTWPLMFDAGVRSTVPELLYITQEELTTACLIDLLAEDTFISRALFDEAFRTRVLDNFRGIVVTWDEVTGKGTHFFWRKHPTEPVALRCYLKDGRLVPHDERHASLAFNVDKDTIINLLKKREIFPSLFMIFSVLHMYGGIKPLVGQGSMTYLNIFRDEWVKTLEEAEYAEEREHIRSLPINGLIAAVCLFQNQHGTVRVAHGQDVLYGGGLTADYLHTIFALPFGSLFTVSAIDVYNYIAQKYIPKEKQLP
ncbi:MAG: hypothetical protein WCT27_05565, partial [Patescibacteria group bacterium]